MKKTLLPTDELNNLTSTILSKNSQEIIDETLELLILAYIKGVESGSSDLNKKFIPDFEQLFDAVFGDTKGKSFEDRLEEYTKSEDGIIDYTKLEEIKRVIETETHRCYNVGLLDVAKKFNAKKTWVTMFDDKVRDSHKPLDNVTIDVDEMFYIGEDFAPCPGLFEKAENNVNCRCELFLEE